jgi:hypothetical protein
MQIEKSRYDTPSYFRALVAAGLIQSKTQIENAWGKWQLVCADPEVIRLSMRLEKVSLPSVAAPFQHGAQVLSAMSEKQIAALKESVGA